MIEAPLISCIIPTHNRSAKVVLAIESILAQTYTELEILVVDDQSIDSTKEVVEAMIQKDQRIRYFRNPNKGANNARNFGIQHAKGKFIAFLDDDDVWMNSKLEKQFKLMSTLGPEFGVVYCTFARKKTTGKILRRHPSRFSSFKNGNILDRLLKRNFITTSTLFVKTEVFQKCGMFDPGYKSFQDWELLTRIARDFHFFYLKEILVNVYESNDSITLDKRGRVLTKLKHLKQFMDLYELNPRLLSGRYSSLGFTLLKLKRFGFSKKFLLRSLKYNALNIEALALLLFLNFRSILGIK
jgi:glycosyltransferase involved in cell wall biosynthesis